MLKIVFIFINIIGAIHSLPANHDFSKSVQEKVKYQYIGTEKCSSVCHNNNEMGFQYDLMKNGPHSNAYQDLISKKAGRFAKKANLKDNPQENTDCLKCHITGGGLDSSYFAGSYKKEDGVTCEACHKREYVTKAFLPKEEDCLRCHNDSVHKTGKFNFAEKRALITHPRPKAKSSDINLNIK